MRKYIARVFILTIVTPVIGLVIWYCVSFYPNLKELNKVSIEGNISIDNVNPIFSSFVVNSESKKGIRIYAMRQAFWSLVFENEGKGNISWHGNNALWFLASYIHFDEKEIFGIWVDCALFGCGKGINTAALKYYGKELHMLTEKELAGMAVLVRSPQKYKPGSKSSEERIKEIMEKTLTHNKAVQLGHASAVFALRLNSTNQTPLWHAG